jgi:large subunit ribosomal protein L10
MRRTLRNPEVFALLRAPRRGFREASAHDTRKEAPMENPRPEKVAVVDEVSRKLTAADAVLLTEYRGLDVAALATLRRALRDAGGEYKVYKNTLVRFAASNAGLVVDDLLTGPTAITFVTERPDGSPGDAVTVAKALRDFARTNPSLIIKGGVLGDKVLGADQARALADVAPREELLARLAGGIAAPMVQMAGLLQALPRNLAYGLKALIDEKGGVPAEAEPAAPAEAAAPATDDTPAPEATPEPAAEAADDTPAAEATDDTAAAAAEPTQES